jgi:hypothetical protein
VVDAITGLGTMPLDIDGWGLDVVIGGSQKAFMIPPGLAFMSVSPKAWKFTETATLPHFYFNLKKEKKSGDAGESSWTPATSLILALAEALKYVKQLGMANLIENAQLLARPRARRWELGLELFRRRPGQFGDGGEGAGGAGFGRDREGIPQSLRRHHRQRPGLHEGADFPHRAPGLLRFRRPVRGHRGLEFILKANGVPVEYGKRRGGRPAKSTNGRPTCLKS